MPSFVYSSVVLGAFILLGSQSSDLFILQNYKLYTPLNNSLLPLLLIAWLPPFVSVSVSLTIVITSYKWCLLFVTDLFSLSIGFSRFSFGKAAFKILLFRLIIIPLMFIPILRFLVSIRKNLCSFYPLSIVMLP